VNAAVISPQEASKRRRLVYASCQGVLSEKDSLTMVALCDNHFSQVETFTPFRFFKEAQSRFNLSPALVKTLVQRFTESQKLAIEHLVDPLQSSMSGMSGMSAAPQMGAPQMGTPQMGTPQMPAQMPAPPTVDNSNKSPEQVVFESFVAKLFSYLQIAQKPNIQSYLSDVLESTKMPQQAKSMLVQSVQAGQFIPQALPSSDMASVMDVLYSCYCELYGPMQADRIFSSIVSEVEMTVPEARQFSPRQFL